MLGDGLLSSQTMKRGRGSAETPEWDLLSLQKLTLSGRQEEKKRGSSNDGRGEGEEEGRVEWAGKGERGRGGGRVAAGGEVVERLRRRY